MPSKECMWPTSPPPLIYPMYTIANLLESVYDRVFTTPLVSLNIPESGLCADFVKRLKNDTGKNK